MAAIVLVVAAPVPVRAAAGPFQIGL
ncbi:MAG: hypothetical protein QOF96_1, partial [Actinomycetota bacterium]|nr:hypothetical protein [Actinomycetota bacterium]